MDVLFSRYWFLIAGVWYALNGILHDIFVVRGYKGGYDRELLRLLMDGHVLILSGVLMIMAFAMVRNNISYSAGLGIVTALFMLVYCCMIFPFLKSIATMVVSAIVLIIGIKLMISN